MSILIKGLEMPKEGVGFLACFVLNEEGRWMFSLMNEGKWYAVVEIPTPHGRLIDADKLEERVKQTMRYFSIKYDIQEAPTVIESEE